MRDINCSDSFPHTYSKNSQGFTFHLNACPAYYHNHTRPPPPTHFPISHLPSVFDFMTWARLKVGYTVHKLTSQDAVQYRDVRIKKGCRQRN